MTKMLKYMVVHNDGQNSQMSESVDGCGLVLTKKKGCVIVNGYLLMNAH